MKVTNGFKLCVFLSVLILYYLLVIGIGILRMYDQIPDFLNTGITVVIIILALGYGWLTAGEFVGSFLLIAVRLLILTLSFWFAKMFVEGANYQSKFEQMYKLLIVGIVLFSPIVTYIVTFPWQLKNIWILRKKRYVYINIHKSNVVSVSDHMGSYLLKDYITLKARGSALFGEQGAKYFSSVDAAVRECKYLGYNYVISIW